MSSTASQVASDNKNAQHYPPGYDPTEDPSLSMPTPIPLPEVRVKG